MDLDVVEPGTCCLEGRHGGPYDVRSLERQLARGVHDQRVWSSRSLPWLEALDVDGQGNDVDLLEVRGEERVEGVVLEDDVAIGQLGPPGNAISVGRLVLAVAVDVPRVAGSLGVGQSRVAAAEVLDDLDAPATQQPYIGVAGAPGEKAAAAVE